MFYFYDPQNKSWKRWQSKAEECQRLLATQSISAAHPGTILKDIDTLLEFVGVGGVVSQSRNASLPGEVLPELNGRVSHTVQLNLKRALLRDYPNLAGIFVLARVMDLLQMKGNRLAVCPEALRFWRSLNPAEQYFALLEAFVFQAKSSVLGGEPTREDTESIKVITGFLDRLTERWRNFDDYDRSRRLGPRGEIPPWRLFVLQQLGVIEIREAPLPAREKGSSGGKGWLVGGARLTPWGMAISWGLVAFAKKCEQAEEAADPEVLDGAEGGEVESGPQPGFGQLQPIFHPYVPEWRTCYAPPASEARSGTHFFKVSLVSWHGGAERGGVWRRLAVPPDISLDYLAEEILRAFKFDSDHMYDFRYRDQRGKSRVYHHPCSDTGPWTPEITVGETDLAINDDMLFTFDYGDNWQFKVRLEKIEDGPCKLGEPKVIESEGKAPEQYPSYQE